MEVIYYDFHNYNHYLIAYFKICTYLMDTNQTCHSFHTEENHILLRQNCDPYSIRNTFREIRSEMFENFNAYMARNNYTFYEFRLVFLQVRCRKRLLCGDESDSETE